MFLFKFTKETHDVLSNVMSDESPYEGNSRHFR